MLFVVWLFLAMFTATKAGCQNVCSLLTHDCASAAALFAFVCHVALKIILLLWDFFFPFSFLSPTRHRLISVRFVMISGIRYAHNALRIFTSEEFSHGDFFVVVIFVMSAVCGSCLFSWC